MLSMQLVVFICWLLYRQEKNIALSWFADWDDQSNKMSRSNHWFQYDLLKCVVLMFCWARVTSRRLEWNNWIAIHFDFWNQSGKGKMCPLRVASLRWGLLPISSRTGQGWQHFRRNDKGKNSMEPSFQNKQLK